MNLAIAHCFRNVVDIEASSENIFLSLGMQITSGEHLCIDENANNCGLHTYKTFGEKRQDTC